MSIEPIMMTAVFAKSLIITTFPITTEQNFDRQTLLYYNWSNTILREKALGIKKKTRKAGG
jgi:hypothetical protein